MGRFRLAGLLVVADSCNPLQTALCGRFDTKPPFLTGSQSGMRPRRPVLAGVSPFPFASFSSQVSHVSETTNVVAAVE
jgi:hypothetical protein